MPRQVVERDSVGHRRSDETPEEKPLTKHVVTTMYMRTNSF